MINTIWGGVTEDNSFGTHEYMELVDRLGTEPFVVGNVGSGTVQEMAEWWEYMNFPGVSPMADQRRALRMGELIQRHSAIMDRYDPEKRVWLIVGEWGTWHQVEPETNPGFLYQQTALRGADVSQVNGRIREDFLADRARGACVHLCACRCNRDGGGLNRDFRPVPLERIKFLVYVLVNWPMTASSEELGKQDRPACFFQWRAIHSAARTVTADER